MSTLNTIMTALGYIVAFAAIVVLVSYSIRQHDKVDELEQAAEKHKTDIQLMDNRYDALDERIRKLEARSQGDDGK